MNYRAEIDGLRAIAVVSVILYHAQIVIFGRDWFEGGFIGVDIFFVISGYLITRIILSELEQTNTFSFIKFYERRARRILPMLLVVIAVCIPFAWQRLIPLDLVDFSKSALSAIGFGSNFFFYFSTTEYGATSALLKPLLHTWSLGVEEQFYIIVPMIILVIWKFARASLLTLLIGMLIISIQFADVMEVRNSELNFFLPFSRFWELLIGSALAFIEIRYGRSKNQILIQTLPIIGLFLIAQSILFFDANTPHPSFQTLMPILGVGLVLAFCSTEDFVGKILSFKPIVGVGLISYSLYLWHFPIFAFGRVGSSNPSTYDKVEWITLAFVFSIISYFVIEKPFRNYRVVSSKKFAFTLILFGALISIFMIFVIKNDGYRVRPYSYVTISPNIEYTSLSEKQKLVGTKCDWIKDDNYPAISFCEAGDINSKNVINVIGDSHAQALFPSLDDFGKNNGIKFKRFRKIKGCSHFIDNVIKGQGSNVSNCSHEFNNFAELLKRDRNDLIIIYRWMFHLYPIDGYQLDMPTKNEAGAEERESYREHFIFADDDYLSTEVAKSASLKRFIEKLADASSRTFILSSVPEVSYDIERVNRDYYINSGWSEVLSELSIGYDEYLTRNSFINKFFSNHQFSNTTLISIENVFCNSFIEGRCVAQYQGRPLYYDDDHLSMEGADLVVQLIMEQIGNAETIIKAN